MGSEMCIRDRQKFTRADTLGDEYTAEKLAESIQQIQKSQAIMERLSEKKKPEKPATVTTTKTAPKPTRIVTTKPDTERIIITAEEFLATLHDKPAPNRQQHRLQQPSLPKLKHLKRKKMYGQRLGVCVIATR